VGCFQLEHKPRTIITWTARWGLTFLIETYLHILKTSHQSSRTDTFNVVTVCRGPGSILNIAAQSLRVSGGSWYFLSSGHTERKKYNSSKTKWLKIKRMSFNCHYFIFKACFTKSDFSKNKVLISFVHDVYSPILNNRKRFNNFIVKIWYGPNECVFR
jgi:hypothetical protein